MAKKTQELLARALEAINSVDYKVSLRWVFYRLLQEGFYSKKTDYQTWTALSSRARKEFMPGWHPDILADETRKRITRSGGHETIEDCIDNLKYELNNFDPVFSVDHFYQQEKYVEIWFEARAMAEQFKHYTDDIDLIPFAGHPSIPFKWGIAKHLERCASRYGKDIIILYFGDYDYHGDIIIDSAESDIRAWCRNDFEVNRDDLMNEFIEKNPGHRPWAWKKFDHPEIRPKICGHSGWFDQYGVYTIADECERFFECLERTGNLRPGELEKVDRFEIEQAQMRDRRIKTHKKYMQENPDEKTQKGSSNCHGPFIEIQ